MGQYVTAAQVRTHLTGTPVSIPLDATLEPLITRSEVDLDAVLGAWVPNENTGRKLNPADMTAGQRVALERAVAAQVEYRLMSGEDALIRHKPSRPGKGGTGGGKPERLPRLGPRVRAELYGHGLLQPHTTVS